MIRLSRVACIVLVLVAGWVVVLSAGLLLLATANEVFGLGLWADGYLGSASFAAFALEVGVAGLAGLAAGAVAFLAAARSAPRAA